MNYHRLSRCLLAGLLAFTATFGAGKAVAAEGESKSIEGNRLSNRREYREMKKTMDRIVDDKSRIAMHKEAYKANKKSDLVIAAHMSKKEMRKAKADLKRDKRHLKIDRRDLKSDQKVALKEFKSAERECSKELREAKRELRRDLRKGNTAELTADAQRVDYLTWKKQKLSNETASLEEDVDEFFAYLDDEIDQVV